MFKWCLVAMAIAACGGKAALDETPGKKGAGGGEPCNCADVCSVAICSGEEVCCGDSDGDCGCRDRDDCNKDCH